MIPDRDWVLRGLCRGSNVDWWLSEDWADKLEAKSVCERCPVRDECLEAALEEEVSQSNLRFGVRGGMLGGERYKEHLRRRKAS